MMPNYIIQFLGLEKIQSGMEVAKVVLDDDGQILLNEGTILTEQLLERLSFWGVSALHVKIPEAMAEQIAKTEEQTEAEEFFEQEYHKTAQAVQQAFEQMRSTKQLPLEELSDLASTSVQSMVNSVGVFSHLHLARKHSEYTFYHSINVAVIAGLLGKWLGYESDDISQLVLSGLLHDIGKSQVPLKILNKPAPLSSDEMAVMRKHAYWGYQLLVNEANLPMKVLYGVIQHHERLDGTGYPLALKKEQIHPFGRIIAIADIYDAMTSNRLYREVTAPFGVVETLLQEMYDKLDPEICTVFLNNVRNCFVGNIVLLSDGRQAEVVYLGQFIAARPVVRTFDGEFIDLEQRKDLSIEQLIKA